MSDLKTILITILISLLIGAAIGIFGVKLLFPTLFEKEVTESIEIDLPTIRLESDKDSNTVVERIEVPKPYKVTDTLRILDTLIIRENKSSLTVKNEIDAITAALDRLDMLRVEWTFSDTLRSPYGDKVFVTFDMTKQQFKHAEFELARRNIEYTYKQFQPPNIPLQNSIIKNEYVVAVFGFFVGYVVKSALD